MVNPTPPLRQIPESRFIRPQMLRLTLGVLSRRPIQRQLAKLQFVDNRRINIILRSVLSLRPDLDRRMFVHQLLHLVRHEVVERVQLLVAQTVMVEEGPNDVPGIEL